MQIKIIKNQILTTHYMEEAEHLCDRVAIVDHGRIVAEGPVGDTLDALLQTPLKIVAEVLLEVQHCLLSKAMSFEDIRRVYSREIALAQCPQGKGNGLGCWRALGHGQG